MTNKERALASLKMALLLQAAFFGILAISGMSLYVHVVIVNLINFAAIKVIESRDE